MKKLESQKLQKENLKSVKCPYGGCRKVYKNGTYKKRPKGFFDKLKPKKKKLTQRFLCPYCKKELPCGKREHIFRAHIKEEIRRAIAEL